MYIGYRGQNILWVSENKYSADQQSNVLEVGDDLRHVDPKILMQEYVVRRGFLIKRCDLDKIPPSQLKVAMVSQYGINCGIATYTKYLCDEMRPLVADLKIFAEDADVKDCDQDEKDGVVRCWKRSGDYFRILPEIAKYDPDVIYVQHEYGSFSHGANWNGLIGHLNSRWRTIVVLHSVYDHPDKLIFEAPCQEVIVHSATGRDLLRSRGVDQCTISHIPHGCMPPIKIETKFSRIESQHVIFQYGFGFEYKGWENAINVVDQLKDNYPDLVYIGVFNVSKFSKSFNNLYYDRIMEQVRQRGLEKHFVLHRGFRSEPILLSYMAQSSVGLFPYWNHPEWRVHGASGAVRLALASGVPTILGDVPFFSEFKGHVPVCDTIQDYVDTITKIFEDPEYRDEVKKKTLTFIQNRTWEKIAKWYLSVKSDEDFTAL